MAPDLNSLSNGAILHDVQRPANGPSAHSPSTYSVPDTLLGDPSARRMRVLCVGTGFSGISFAYNLKQSTQNVDLVLYEKNSGPGGVWLKNRYPGCRCDLPSQQYQLPFAPNPAWTERFATAQEITKYLSDVSDTLDLRKHMVFNSEVESCRWDDFEGKWKVRIQQPGREPFEDSADFVVHAGGLLNNWSWPRIPGRESFKGKVLHTAAWDSSYTQDQWKDDKVAVIGLGSSAIQVVYGMQPTVKHLDVFIRSGIWLVDLGPHTGFPTPFSDAERHAFRSDVSRHVGAIKTVENLLNDKWLRVSADAAGRKEITDRADVRMKSRIRDERLKAMVPDFNVGCRPSALGDHFLEAIQRDNCDAHLTGVERFTEDGIVGSDGIERKVDAVICATGFDTSLKPRFPIIGQDGVSLHDRWGDDPDAYMGMTVPNLPNFVTMCGPYFPFGTGGSLGGFTAMSKYAVALIKKMQHDNILKLSPKESVTAQFKQHAEASLQHTVWAESCTSRFKNPSTGKLNGVWPGSMPHYTAATSAPRFEDYDITYCAANRFAYLGRGWTAHHGAARGARDVGDKSPYFGVRWLSVPWVVQKYGVSKEEARRIVLDDVARQAREQAERMMDENESEGGERLVGKERVVN